MRSLLLGGCMALLLWAPAAAVTDEQLLYDIQSSAFQFFWNEVNPDNGLIRDRSQPWSPCSIASTGFGLSAICVGVEHGWVTRDDAGERVETTLETFWRGPQGTATSGTIGHRGFFYHVLDMTTATRTWDSELSTIDTSLLLAGILDAKQFFSETDSVEEHIRQLADSIYQRVDWDFARNSTAGIYMGWKPGTGFGGFGLWRGYNEAMILYILALGSPTHPQPSFVWNTWLSTYSWQTLYGQSYVIFPPLFGHQYSHCWIDFRGVQDSYMADKGITYFENSRRATLAQQAYCIANPGGWVGYSDILWGLTASDGPTGYNARGAPPAQNDDGTLTPTAVVGSLPFAEEIVLPTLHNLYDNYPALWGPYGFRDAFNPTVGWYDTDYIGIDQGPIVLMIENHRSAGVWKRFMAIPEILAGLWAGGFQPVVGVESPAQGSGLALSTSEPNPIADAATIRFRLPEAGPVRLSLFDVRGREIARLVDEPRPAGEHAVRWTASGLERGVYFCRLDVSGATVVRKLAVVGD